ncbi:SmdB family multidrug efflux ABC transporter permease/ATP-binding protein [Tatumella citrea]
MSQPVSFMKTLKRLLIYGMPWKKQLLTAVLLLVLAAAAQVAGPVLISYFIDHFISADQWLWGPVIVIGAGFLILQILAAWFNYRQSLLFNQAAIGVVQKLRCEVMDAALRQPLKAFDTQPVGQLVSRVTNDTEVVRDLYITVVASVLRSATLIIAMLVAMFALNWQMALIAVCIFPLVFGVMIAYQKRSTGIARLVRTYLADINNSLNEVINGMTVVQQFRRQKHFAKQLKQHNENHYQARMKILRLDAFLLRPLLNLFTAVILAMLVLVFCLAAPGHFEVGVLYAFIAYLGRIEEPLIELTTRQSLLQQAVVSAERIFELMDTPAQHYGQDNQPIQSGQLAVSNLSFAYQPGRDVLKNIYCHASEGGFLALVGHTGSGKSTLASLLMGYYPVERGYITIDGRSVSEMSHQVLRKGVGMVQQDPTVLADTLLENIRLGRNISEAMVLDALQQVRLTGWMENLPQGIHTPLGEQGSSLSAGQKQLLALARILVDVPALLILDEATASIDSGTELAVQQVLAQLRNKTTLVVIAHRLSTITTADNILVLDRGEIIESGTHAQLLAMKGRYRQMYQLQRAGHELSHSNTSSR